MAVKALPADFSAAMRVNRVGAVLLPDKLVARIGQAAGRRPIVRNHVILAVSMEGEIDAEVEFLGRRANAIMDCAHHSLWQMSEAAIIVAAIERLIDSQPPEVRIAWAELLREAQELVKDGPIEAIITDDEADAAVEHFEKEEADRIDARPCYHADGFRAPEVNAEFSAQCAASHPGRPCS